MAGKTKIKPGAKKPRCAICNTTVDVTLGPDPYLAEICGDDTPRPLCEDCRAHRREEV